MAGGRVGVVEGWGEGGHGKEDSWGAPGCGEGDLN